MTVFSVWIGLVLTILGLVAAVVYLPLLWTAVLLTGLSALIVPIVLDMRRESQEQLKRFARKQPYYWQGAPPDED